MLAWKALTALPWGTILKRATVVIAAADALRAHSRLRGEAPSSGDVGALQKRVSELEQHQRANAELAKQLAEQTSALAVAARETAVRTRQAFVLALAGCVLALVAILIAWLR
jgi:hypothetical protein